MSGDEKVFVVLVDELDNQVGTMEKMEAHRKALLHRAVSVFIMNSKGEWLMQQRALSKYHSSGLWSNTCCTHPNPGESYSEAAHRRLMEEMGMECELEELFDFIYKIKLDNELTEHELDHVFIGVTDVMPEINREEVEDWKYMKLEDIKIDVLKNPESYSYWFRKIYETVADQIAGS